MFDNEDLAEHEERSRRMRLSLLPIAGGFLGVTLFRIWQIKHSNKDMWLGLGAIIASYLPGFATYNYYK